jgi:two-component system phosphate regulon response regulator PhoB
MMEHPAQHGCRILVVEDDLEVGGMVVDQLQMVGYDVLWETSGRGALRALQEDAAPPDLILLDLLLPDIAGEEVYAAVDAHPDWGTINFIVMSGLSTGAARGSLLPRGVYIQKPFEPAQLLALVAHYCGQTAGTTRSR